MRKSFTSLFTFLLTFLLSCMLIASSSCQKKEKDDPITNLLVILGILNQAPEYYAKLYYINPLISERPLDANLVYPAGPAETTPGRKKLVLVHGWHFNDRSPPPYPFPTLFQLRDRILSENWSTLFGMSVFKTNVLLRNYDVYAFDYLTSEPIEENGRRLRTAMDNLFAGDTGTVYLYGNSMGGLVARFALYDGIPSYLVKVVTTGTPFHGSPWASPQFQEAIPSVLGSLASYMTNTKGGLDLRWDNYDNNATISGSSNPKLTDLNTRMASLGANSLFFPYFGSVDAGGAAMETDSNLALAAGCLVLNVGPYNYFSDCVVPIGSSTLSGYTTGTPNYNAQAQGAGDMGNYHHSETKLGGNANLATPYGNVLNTTEFP